jgi:hypothetical protein
MSAVENQKPAEKSAPKSDSSVTRKGYDKKKAFSKVTKDGKTRVTPHLFRKKDETQEQFLKRMNTDGYLGPDKPKGHWAPDNRVYHMGETPKDCPYCSGSLPAPGTKRSTAKDVGSWKTMPVLKIGQPSSNKEGGKANIYVSKSDFDIIEKLYKLGGADLRLQFKSKNPIVKDEKASSPQAKSAAKPAQSNPDASKHQDEPKDKLDELTKNTKPPAEKK